MPSPRIRRYSRLLAFVGASLTLFLIIAAGYFYFAMIAMPGSTFAGPLPPLTESQKALATDLRTTVTHLAATIGKRSIYHPKELAESALYLKEQLTAAGYEVNEHSFPTKGSLTPNLEATLKGTSHPNEIVVIGAHYDTTQRSPGADDNASGCAAILALARSFKDNPQPRTIKFVLFPNEELPTGGTSEMGSWIYAKKARAAGDNITAMLSLEMLGYFTDASNSQKYPAPLSSFYPTTGNFIAFVSNYDNRALVKQCVRAFRAGAQFPSEGAALPNFIRDVSRSDHFGFGKEGYHALMVTDTANFRNPNYHSVKDTPDTLNYDSMARVVEGLRAVLINLASPGN
ncbi:MAG: M20/M25/M40 family metallo-hydrolase [Phycisphaeraceae bacterium]|nr:M20/M25/M40 family metallo-hydrolase [Phycisphaeraceae bacterium]